MPQDLLNLLNYLGISPTTGKAKDKFDCRFVLKSNFDFSNMRLSPGQRWEVSNIKSPYKGKPTILNACGDNVSVRAIIKGEALKDPSITGQLFKKMAYQKLMAFLAKHNLTLYDYSSSKFIEEQTSKEFSKAYAQDIFESISKGGQDRLLSSLKLSNSKDFKPLHELFLKKCSSGYNPKSSEATLSNYGNFSHLTQDGLAVVKPYYDDDIGQVLINSCKIDTPSTKRHTPKKDGILVRKSENTTKQEIMVVFPFQIRKI